MPLPDASPRELMAWCEMILPGQPCPGSTLDFHRFPYVSKKMIPTESAGTQNHECGGRPTYVHVIGYGAAAPEKQSLGAVPPQ